ncbi:hypothetical protein BDZ97DRAFT_1764794 [Flammula alnicola]|nr:hypothetical protein BDZ97DRAFT_1764794 [Flammula alnicola]
MMLSHVCFVLIFPCLLDFTFAYNRKRMSSNASLKDYWRSSRKPTNNTLKQRTVVSPVTSLAKVSTSREKRQKVNNARSLQQDPHSTLPTPSEKQTFPLLSLPFELVLLVLHHISDLKALISLSHTCSTLRSPCGKLYLRDQGVIPAQSSYTVVRLRSDVLPVAVSILTSLTNLFKATDYVSLEVDIFCLVEFQVEICNFISRSNICDFVVQFCHDDQHHAAMDYFIRFALISALASLHSCVSFKIRQTDQDEASTVRAPIRLSHSAPNNHEALYPTMLESMNHFFFLEFHLDFFSTPFLRKMLPVLLQAASACEVVVDCPTQRACRDVFTLLQCPAMEKLEIIVRDSSPILVPNHFALRHPNLKDLGLLNRVGSRVEVNYNNFGHLNLPSLTRIAISGNYATWTMLDVSSLSSLEIRPVAIVVRPANSYKYCEAVQSLIRVMQASSSLQFPTGFILTMSFPVDLMKHTNSFFQGQRLQCTCSPGTKDAPILNVKTLELDVDRFDRKLFLTFLLDQDYLSLKFGRIAASKVTQGAGHRNVQRTSITFIESSTRKATQTRITAMGRDAPHAKRAERTERGTLRHGTDFLLPVDGSTGRRPSIKRAAQVIGK